MMAVSHALGFINVSEGDALSESQRGMATRFLIIFVRNGSIHWSASSDTCVSPFILSALSFSLL